MNDVAKCIREHEVRLSFLCLSPSFSVCFFYFTHACVLKWINYILSIVLHCTALFAPFSALPFVLKPFMMIYNDNMLLLELTLFLFKWSSSNYRPHFISNASFSGFFFLRKRLIMFGCVSVFFYRLSIHSIHTNSILIVDPFNVVWSAIQHM